MESPDILQKVAIDIKSQEDCIKNLESEARKALLRCLRMGSRQRFLQLSNFFAFFFNIFPEFS